MSKQFSNEIAPGDLKVSLKLSHVKPFHTKGIVDTCFHLGKEDDSIIKGFDAAEITEAIKFENDVLTRVENPFAELRQQLLQLLLFLFIALNGNMNIVKI